MFILAHTGAGLYENTSRHQAFVDLLESALSAGTQLLNDDATADRVAAEVVAILERSSLTNAGLGSNLTLKGTVECDASTCVSFEGNVSFFGVGAAPGIQSPALASFRHLQDLKSGEGMTTRLITGKEAWISSKMRGLVCAHSEEEIPTYNHTVNSVERWNTAFARRLESERSAEERKMARVSDTVGCICIDKRGSISVCVSSGGSMMRPSGCVGPSALWGCGSYVTKTSGVCLTGEGDIIASNHIALRLAGGSRASQVIPANRVLAFLMVNLEESDKLQARAYRTDIGLAFGCAQIRKDSSNWFIKAKVATRDDPQDIDILEWVESSN